MTNEEYEELQKENEERFWRNQESLPNDGSEIIFLGYMQLLPFDKELHELLDKYNVGPPQ